MFHVHAEGIVVREGRTGFPSRIAHERHEPLTRTFHRGTGALIATVTALLLAFSLIGPALAATPDSRDDFELGRFRDVSDFGDFSTPLNQSLAILALERADGTAPSEAAVALLLAQQCDDGGFPSAFKAPSTAGAPACSSSVDTTAFAVQALHAVGEADAVQDAVAWLVSAQEEGGVFGSPDGLNANSTGVAAVALDIGADLGVTGAADARDAAQDWIVGVQEGCEANERAGVIPFNAETDGFLALATAQAIIGLMAGDLGTLDGTGQASATPSNDCGQDQPALGDPGVAAAEWLASQLEDGERIQTEFDGDFFDAPGPTIDALFAFASLDDSLAGDEIENIAAWLQTQVAGYTQGAPFDRDDAAYGGATAKLALGMIVAGVEPTDVGGIDLIAQLEALEVTELGEVTVTCGDGPFAPDDEVECSIAGLIGNETVDVLVEVNPTLLDDAVTADPTGAATFAFALPDDVTEEDTVTITVDGLGAEGLAGLTLDITEPDPVVDETDQVEEVTDDTDEAEEDEETLPETGGTTALLGLFGLVAIAAGTLTVRTGRRGRKSITA